MYILDSLLFVASLFLLCTGCYLTWKMRLVQGRIYAVLRAHRENKREVPKAHMLSSSRALFTAMSTTLGISTIVGPVIAIKLGGPGALFGFLLASILGSAMTYVEVTLSIHCRKTTPDGHISGGPMQYLAALLSPKMARFYAIGCAILLLGWSAAQANQLTAVLSASTLGDYTIPVLYSSLGLCGLLFLALRGGVHRVGAFSARLVPMMFVQIGRAHV